MIDFRKFSWWTRLSGGVFLLLLVGAVTLLAVGWWRDPAARVVSVDLRHREPLLIGAPLEVVVVVRLPWFRWPLQPARLDPGDGWAASLQESDPEFVGLGWGSWDWRFQGLIQAYRPGSFAEGTATVLVRPQRDGAGGELEVGLPEYTVRSLLNGLPHDRRLVLAPDMPSAAEVEPAAWTRPALMLVGVVVLAIVLSVFFSKSQDGEDEGRELSAGEAALRRLLLVDGRLPMAADDFFVEITDTLKMYGERQFAVAAQGKTSEELEVALRQAVDLDEGQRQRLRRVFELADVVKFARGRAGVGEMRQTVRELRRFVAETMSI